MLEEHLSKINNFFEEEQNNSNQLESKQGCSLFEIELKKSQNYLQKIRNNGAKIQNLIQENDRLKHQNTLHLRTIQMNLKKELQTKLLVSELQQEIQILNQKLILEKAQEKQKTQQSDQNVLKEVQKLTEKLMNCKEENSILRNENKNIYSLRMQESKKFRQFEQGARTTIKKLKEEVQLLKSELQLQKERSMQYELLQSENHSLKIQNKNLLFQADFAVKQYDSVLQQLKKQLETERYSKTVIEAKYEELTETIKMVDGIRDCFNNKKKNIEIQKMKTQPLFEEETQMFEDTKKQIEAMKQTKKNKKGFKNKSKN